MVFVKKSTFFSYVFFWAKKSHKQTFFDILDRKRMLFRPQKKTSKKLYQNRHFAKGLVHGFCQKIDLFLICFFFSKKAIKKYFLKFWIEKKVLWTSKVKFLQSRKKSSFCKQVSPWFLSKNRPFSHMFFFWAKKSQKETFFDILNRKQCFLDHKR